MSTFSWWLPLCNSEFVQNALQTELFMAMVAAATFFNLFKSCNANSPLLVSATRPDYSNLFGLVLDQDLDDGACHAVNRPDVGGHWHGGDGERNRQGACMTLDLEE